MNKQTRLFITKLLLFSFLMTSLILVDTSRVFACSCAISESATAEIENADAVFAGVVSTVDRPTGDTISSADPITVTFEVAQVWTGPNEQTLTVTTARDDASCGYHFAVGVAYLVYARSNPENEGGLLSVSLCSRTAPLINALDDLYELGPGEKPAAEQEQSSQTPVSSPLATPTPSGKPTLVPTATPVTSTVSVDAQAILTGDDIGFKVVNTEGEQVDVVLMVRINGEWQEAIFQAQPASSQDAGK